MNTNNKQKGFTLVETLVAISILVMSITGAFTAAQNGISSAIYSKDQIIAFNLAAEGAEQIRNLRDENGIKGQNWLTGIANSSGDPCYFGKVCTVDAVNTDVNGKPIMAACSGALGTCPVLKQDPTNGFYGYASGWTDTTFKREISLTSINSHEISILVRVSWSKGLVNRQFDIKENLFDWK
jgi:prepilin-type N-terminal cleavage/methylation domain-containing protein